MGLQRHRTIGRLYGTHSATSLRLFLCALGALLLLSSPAWAQKSSAKDAAKAKMEASKQKVLGLRIEGFELSAKDREDLFKVVQQRLQAYPTIALVRPPDEELTDLMIDLACLDIDVDCLTKVGRKRMADKVFYAQVDVVEKRFRLTVRLIDVTKGIAERDRQAMVSNQTELTTGLEREIIGAFGEPPPPPPKDGRLIIESDAGAKIFIDGGLVGSGRVRLKKPPGLYVVRITKPGFEDALFRVDLEAGRTARKVAELKAIPTKAAAATAKDEGPKETSDVAAEPVVETESVASEFYETWWFWTAVGSVVVAGTVTGIILGTGGDPAALGDLQISIDANSAWRDGATRLGSRP